MAIKIFLLATLAFLASTYTTEDSGVLVLGDDDFPSITSEFTHILIEFYAPWCGHCKKLAPVYAEVAETLRAQNSVVRLAKVDATEHPNAAKSFEVKGYPTLFFFLNGEKLDYTGQRTAAAMTNWLLKRTRDPVSEISPENYAELEKAKGVSVVYHGDINSAEGAEVLNSFAVADDFNTYYWGTNLGKPEGTLELFRDFDVPITYGNALDERATSWIVKNQRPLVVQFDERTIGEIFTSKKFAAVLFNGENSDELAAAFNEAAKEYSETDGQPLLFTSLNSSSEHLDNFAKYIKIDRTATPFMLINSKDQQKYVLRNKSPSKEDIVSFLSNYESSKFGLTDEVTSGSEETTEEL